MSEHERTLEEWKAEAMAARRERWWVSALGVVCGSTIFGFAAASLIGGDEWGTEGAGVGLALGVLLKLRDRPSP